MIKIIKYSILLFLVIIITISCKQTELISSQNSIQDGKYDSHLNGKSLGVSIEYFSESVKKLDILTFYQTWKFPKDSTYSKTFISTNSPKEYAISSNVINESGAGTALVVYYDKLLAGFLTCAHVVNYPDTVYTYYDKNKNMVKSLAVIIRQQIFISNTPEGSEVEVIAFNIDKDLAFLKKEINNNVKELQPIDFKVGSTSKLEWGSEVYILGFPLGKLMLTKGVVSIDKSIKKRFLSDATYNRGISGSPVFAVLDGSENIEWIGMASSASAQTLRYLSPQDNDTENILNKNDYYGDVFIDEKLLINYGVTYSIPIEEIITFIARNKSKFRNSGFNTDLLPTTN